VVDELECDHEEADTRLLLHALHASRDNHNVIVQSPDTDVAMIALSLKESIPCNLYFNTGVRNKNRIIDLQKIQSSLGDSAKALIGLHVYTGCDSTSAFHGRSKKRALDLMKNSATFICTFTELSKEFTLSSSLVQGLETFACALYGHVTL